jgi:glutaconate CoA-transferase subunit A
MADKTMSLVDAIGQVRSGMTIGIGGWGSRRKPMALVRALLRTDVTDLTVVSFGGPDVGLLCAAGKVRKVRYGFVSLDSIALDPHFGAARMAGRIETAEYDEGMFVSSLRAGADRLSFLPTRAGLGSDVMLMNPDLRKVYVAVPGVRMDVSFIHLNRGDAAGNGQYLGPDPYFDDVIAMASDRCFMSVERIVTTAELASAPPQTLLVPRMFVAGVVETPHGAHFTTCEPDYGRDERFQAHYAASAADEGAWSSFVATYLSGDEQAYQDAVGRFGATDTAGMREA